MKNCSEARVALGDVFRRFKAGEISASEAGEYANIVGKMVSSAKVQVAYYDLRQAFMAPNEMMPKIEFLEEGERSMGDGGGDEKA